MIKQLTYCLITSLAYFFSCFIYAEAKLSVSYVEHPAVRKIYLPIVEAMYKEAKLPIRLFKVSNSPRSVEALNDGLFDADTGKILSSIKHHENIVYVPTPISTVGLYLICLKSIVCDETVLNDESHMIISRFSKKMLTNILPIKAGMAQILSQQKINKMLNIGRVNYSLIADDISSAARHFQHKYSVVLVSKESYFHILHKKNQGIIPQLDFALKEVLKNNLAKQSKPNKNKESR